MVKMDLWLQFTLTYGCGFIPATVSKHLMKNPFTQWHWKWKQHFK